MRDHGSWSISLGNWSGVYVRLHMFFLLFAVIALYLGWLNNAQTESSTMWSVWAPLGILLISVILHEVGHVVAAHRWGGGADEIVLWPFGGLSPVHVPPDPHAELMATLAGPAVNAAISGAICFPILVMQVDRETLWGLFHPLSPTVFSTTFDWLFVVKLTFWINWLLFTLNLIPAYPFDGGRASRAALLILRPEMDRPLASNIVAGVAKFCAFALAGVSLAMLLGYSQTKTGMVPAWFALQILAIFIYFSAKQEEFHEDETDDDDVPFGYDFSQGYTSLERSVDPPQLEQSGPFLRWLDQRRETRQKRQTELEAEEEKRVDDILARLHEVGMDNLSPDERSLLDRVSTRYRNRQNKA